MVGPPNSQPVGSKGCNPADSGLPDCALESALVVALPENLIQKLTIWFDAYLRDQDNYYDKSSGLGSVISREFRGVNFSITSFIGEGNEAAVFLANRSGEAFLLKVFREPGKAVQANQDFLSCSRRGVPVISVLDVCAESNTLLLEPRLGIPLDFLLMRGSDQLEPGEHGIITNLYQVFNATYNLDNPNCGNVALDVKDGKLFLIDVY